MAKSNAFLFRNPHFEKNGRITFVLSSQLFCKTSQAGNTQTEILPCRSDVDLYLFMNGIYKCKYDWQSYLSTSGCRINYS